MGVTEWRRDMSRGGGTMPLPRRRDERRADAIGDDVPADGELGPAFLLGDRAVREDADGEPAVRAELDPGTSGREGTLDERASKLVRART